MVQRQNRNEYGYVRNCPKCDKELRTTNKYYFNKALISNSPCLSCSQKGKIVSETARENMRKNHADIRGEKNPFYNKKHSDETKKIISEKITEKMSSEEVRLKISERQKEYYKTHDNPFKDKRHSDETKSKISEFAKQRFKDEGQRKHLSKKTIEWHRNNINPFKGKSHTDFWKKMKSIQVKEYYKKFPHPWIGKKHKKESIEKMRAIGIERVKKIGVPFHPSYNPKSIPIIESYGKENGYNFKHAENGGEYQVPNTTFYVDGYDPINNVVIEFDEKRHKIGNNAHIDKWRQDKIGNILKCKFVRIYEEDGSIIEFDYTTKD